MSCVRKIKTFKEIKTVKIDTLDKVQLEKIIEKIKTAIDQKFLKLKSVLKNYYIWQNNNYLIVNDPYLCLLGANKVWSDFNIQETWINTQGLRGFTIALTDPLIALLNEIGENYDFSRVLELQKKKINTDKYLKLINKDENLISILKQIKEQEMITYQTSRKIRVKYYDFGDTVESKGSWSNNNEEKYKLEINKFITNVNNHLEQTKQDLLNGTSKLIAYKAERMGYSVKQTKINDKVQLVLERID